MIIRKALEPLRHHHQARSGRRIPDACAALIGVEFVLHGAIFVVQPAAVRRRLTEGPLTPRQFRALGIAEVGGGAVLLAKSASPAVPAVLVKFASSGVIAVLVPATVLHLGKREWGTAAGTAISAALAASALWDASRHQP